MLAFQEAEGTLPYTDRSMHSENAMKHAKREKRQPPNGPFNFLIRFTTFLSTTRDSHTAHSVRPLN